MTAQEKLDVIERIIADRMENCCGTGSAILYNDILKEYDEQTGDSLFGYRLLGITPVYGIQN